MDKAHQMTVRVCDFPESSSLHNAQTLSAYFRDSYCATLKDAESSMVSIFFAIFGHHPKWMQMALIARNKAVALVGLDAPPSSEILRPQRKEHYVVGDKIGPWPIYRLTQNELVAGRDNKHLDFRLSVIKVTEAGNSKVVVSTVCQVHNLFGKVYLFFVIPFHKLGVKYIMNNAVVSGRL
jgi:hypothetical protein